MFRARALTAPNAPTPQAKSFQSLAREVTAHLSAPIAPDTQDRDIAAARDLIESLEAVAGQIAFFGAGLTSLSGQAIAQVAGWNIPGVGEPGQRLRPRTRIYDTFDPDTLRQVAETLDFDRVALVFVVSPNVSETSRHQAAAMIPPLVAALGADAGRHLACVVPDASDDAASGDGAVSQIVQDVERQGGRIVSFGAQGHALSQAALLPGLARGVDVAAVHAGACSLFERAVAFDGDWQAAPAFWPAVLGSLALEDRAHGRPTAVSIAAAADRYGRAAAFVAAQMAALAPEWDVAAIPQAILGQDHAALGLGMRQFASDTHPARSALTLLTPGAWPQTSPAQEAAAAWVAQTAERAAQQQRAVRVLSCPLDDPYAYGALMAQAMLDPMLAQIAAAVGGGDDASAAPE